MFFEHLQSSFGILLLQIIVILVCCRIFGWLFLKFGQPTVVGEILAGIFLGPSLLGSWFPEAFAWLFPPESFGNISLLSQFGLILFMFVIGMELDIAEVRKKLKETVIISSMSMIAPFLLGMLTAYFIYDRYVINDTPFLSFALFIGIALSITAFPVLARIIQEKGFTRTHLGTISLASAANGDIAAWCMLAVIVSIARAGSMTDAIFSVVFAAVYMVVMFHIIRPFLRMVGQVYHNEEVISKGLVAFIFLILLVSSFLTEALGLHALFGAFMAGVVMPPDLKFRRIMTDKVEAVALSLFLPLFFVLTGLKTEIGLLNTPSEWLMCLIFVVIAVVGKFGGATLSARFTGEKWRDSLYIGVLMNTRGLMELVVLTIGYEMEILSPSIFAMLVLMTLITTFMTVPMLSLIRAFERKHKRRLVLKRKEASEKTFRMLLSFGRAGNAPVMLNVAQQMFSRRKEKLEITALHLTAGADVNPLQTGGFQSVSFAPILEEAALQGINIRTRYEIANNIGDMITNIVNDENYNFLLVGAGITWSNLPNDIAANRYRESGQGRYLKPLGSVEPWFFPSSLLHDKTHTFIEQSLCPVGVFVNRDFTTANNVLLILGSEHDDYLLPYAQTLMKHTNGAVAILYRADGNLPNSIEKTIKTFRDNRLNITLLTEKAISGYLLSHYDFMLIAYETWNEVSEIDREALQQMPSTLIISK